MSNAKPAPAKPMPDRRGYWGQYWKHAQERCLMFQRCNDCGHRFFYARICCPQCASERVEWFQSGGEGVVYSYTVVNRHNNPAFQAEAPYVIALADMADLSPGCRMLARVVDCAPGDVRIGMPVKVTFAPATDDFRVPVFTPKS